MFRLLLPILLLVSYSKPHDYNHNFNWYPVKSWNHNRASGHHGHANHRHLVPHYREFSHHHYYDDDDDEYGLDPWHDSKFEESAEKTHHEASWNYGHDFGQPWNQPSRKTTQKPKTRKPTSYPFGHPLHNHPPGHPWHNENIPWTESPDLEYPTMYSFGHRITTNAPSKKWGSSHTTNGHPYHKPSWTTPKSPKGDGYLEVTTEKSDGSNRKSSTMGHFWSKMTTHIGSNRPKTSTSSSSWQESSWSKSTNPPFNTKNPNRKPNGHPWNTHLPDLEWIIHFPTSTENSQSHHWGNEPCGIPWHNHPPGQKWPKPEITEEKQKVTTPKIEESTQIPFEDTQTITELPILDLNFHKTTEESYPIIQTSTESKISTGNEFESTTIENIPKETTPKNTPEYFNIIQPTTADLLKETATNVPIGAPDLDVITTTPEKPLVIFFETPKPEIGNIGTTTVIPTTLPTFHISSTPKIIEKPITTTIIEIQKAIESFEQTGEAPKVSAQPTPFPTETPDILGPKEVPINPDVIKPETPKEILYASDPLPDVKLSSSLNEKEKPLVNLIPIISLNDGLKTGPPLFKVNPPVIIIHHDQNVTTKIDIPVVPKDDNSLFVLLADDETNDGVKITSKKPVVVINHDFDIKEDARAQELAFLQNLLTKLNNNKESQIFDLNNLPPNVQIIEDKNEIASIKQMFNIETEMQSQNKVFVSKIQDPKIYLSKTQKNEEEIKIGQDILQIIKSGEIDTSKLIKIETPEDLESVKQEIKISILNSLNNLYEKENLELKENPTPEVTTKLTPKPRGNRKWRPKHHHRTTRQTLGTTPERIPANVKDAFKEIFSIDLENERRDSIPISPPNKNNCNPKIGNNKCGSEFSFIPEKTINQDDLVHSINSGKFPIANLLPNGHTPEMYSPEVLEEIQKDIGGALLKGIAKYYVGSLDNKNDSHNGSLSDFLRIGKTQNK